MVFGLLQSKAKRAAQKPPEEDEASFGNLAIALGYCTREDIVEARRKQTTMRPRIGEILVDEKKLTPEQRDEILLRQKVARNVATNDEIHRHNTQQKNKLFSEIKEGITEVNSAQARVGEMLAKKV